MLPFPIGLLTLLLVGGPAPANGQTSVLAVYEFSGDGRHRVRLPRALEEVSGLAMAPEGRLFAHHDERAIFYELDMESGRILKAFSAGFNGVRGDFEGIALAGERFFLSTSRGEIVETAEGSPGSAMEYHLHRTDLGERCELEGLAFDPEAGTLLLPCKEVRTRDLRDHIVVFSVEVATMTVSQLPRIFLPLDELEAMGLKGSFSPSGIEVHPETGNLFLVSARGEALLEFSSQGRLLGVQNLKKKTHPQPEGITFDSHGALLIADEGQGSRGRLTRYPPRGQEGGPPR